MNENPYYQNMNEKRPSRQKASNLSIAALVLGIISIVTSLFFINIPIAIISIILGAYALVKKYSGKGFSQAAIGLSLLSLTMSAFVVSLTYPLLVAMPQFYTDINKLYSKDYKEIVEEYDRSGQLPDYMDKYYEGELGEFFDEYYGGFDNFFDKTLRIDK